MAAERGGVADVTASRGTLLFIEFVLLIMVLYRLFGNFSISKQSLVDCGWLNSIEKTI